MPVTDMDNSMLDEDELSWLYQCVDIQLNQIESYIQDLTNPGYDYHQIKDEYLQLVEDYHGAKYMQARLINMGASY